jgi:hypothetical protein
MASAMSKPLQPTLPQFVDTDAQTVQRDTGAHQGAARQTESCSATRRQRRPQIADHDAQRDRQWQPAEAVCRRTGRDG